ncbi:hypothetical protein [Brevundimonas sp.]|uniref:hypothetical protein n=1 Tax=Brevundimonas sp. TaxID=1871086 RepID=UPI0025BE9964|nr:hypothetical protein [Brevundimonas sp.]
MSTGDHGLYDRDGAMIRKGRVSPALRTAITLIVHEGLTVADAAKRTGYKTESLAKALIKPHVKAFRADVKRAWLASETEQAWLTAADLQRRGMSEDVRLKAAKVFIDADKDARAAMPEQARQLVQIITKEVHLGGQPTNNRLPGVIEAEPYQPLSLPSSDSERVRRADFEDDDDE